MLAEEEYSWWNIQLLKFLGNYREAGTCNLISTADL
jgi:hypothetical protein